MPPQIAIVTDSGVQQPDRLAVLHGARVVPLTIVVDGEPLLEHEEIDSATFYERLGAGATVSTAAPSPGQFLEQYEAAAESGATTVLSIHLSSALSASASAASVAAQLSPVPVVIFDTCTSGFGVDMCVDAAASALVDGADADSAVAAAKVVRAGIANIFVVGQPALLERGGRSTSIGRSLSATSVWATILDDIIEVGKIEDVDQLAELMAAHVASLADGAEIWLAVGHAASQSVARHVGDTIAASTPVREHIEYEVAPSLGAHLGAGTVAATVHSVA